jgi:hypothetical protein
MDLEHASNYLFECRKFEIPVKNILPYRLATDRFVSAAFVEELKDSLIKSGKVQISFIYVNIFSNYRCFYLNFIKEGFSFLIIALFPNANNQDVLPSVEVFPIARPMNPSIQVLFPFHHAEYSHESYIDLHDEYCLHFSRNWTEEELTKFTQTVLVDIFDGKHRFEVQFNLILIL